MKKSTLLSLCMFLLWSIAFSEEKKPEKTPEGAEKEKAKKELPYDKGPDKIDVSGSPKEIQEKYKLFSQKCSQCHTLARPINAPYKAEDWNRYVKRMMRKPGSGIKSSEGKQIYEFLKYYSEVKKKEKKDNKEPQKKEPEQKETEKKETENNKQEEEKLEQKEEKNKQ